MKIVIGFFALVVMLGTGGVAAAEEIVVSEPFPEGYVLNPAGMDDTLIFGDVQASVLSVEPGEADNRLVTLEIVNDSNVTLWVSADTLLSFYEGRFNGNAVADDAAVTFQVTSMETSEGVASVAYEWFMAIPAGGSGTVVLEVGPEVENVCYRPFGLNQSGLTSDETQRIHGCWLLEADSQE